MKKVLALENGQIFSGEGFGADDEALGEVVFNTGMTGYQEVLTDPSYYGQIVMMTYPLIGNYGINDEDTESDNPMVRGFIVRENCPFPSNFRSRMTIDEYLKKHNIAAIKGIDTRSLTIALREYGTMKGMISDASGFDFDKAKEHICSYEIKDAVMSVSCSDISHYDNNGILKIGILDLGMKNNIVRELLKRRCNVTVLPAGTPPEAIINGKFDGIMLSNGPGDPKDAVFAIDTIKCLLGRIPVFGICLGHQLAALALGCDTVKLKYGHRGANHPVKDLTTGRTYITSQNHGYTVRSESFGRKGIELTHINLNDSTVEGFRCRKKLLFTVQFHPEASPGPMDTSWLFDRFIDMIGADDA